MHKKKEIPSVNVVDVLPRTRPRPLVFRSANFLATGLLHFKCSLNRFEVLVRTAIEPSLIQLIYI